MSSNKEHRVGIIMNGVTGRMGTNQHLMRSIKEIIEQGGVEISSTEKIMPNPILVGRNPIQLKKLAELSGIKKTSTDLPSLLDDPQYTVYFDSQTTERRSKCIKQAIKAGKNIYCEKPTALTSVEALELHKLAEEAGVKNGVVQDKLWLPGIMKLKSLMSEDFFGEILSVRGEFGYWVFEGDIVPAQRPSWNYRKEDGGGMVLDMIPHWRYLIDNVFGEIKALNCLVTTHIKERWDEEGNKYNCTADDAAYSTFELENGVIAHFNSSWSVRVRRDDLLTLQVDGTKGSAVVGLRDCWIQPYGATPRPIWNPEIAQGIDFFDTWQKMPEQQDYDNAFKIQWELFLKHIVCDTPFQWNLLEGAKGVQLAELALESSEKKVWVNV
ncbi:MAG: Gfo/Idh/MocA family oxidoreductase [Verrucomicrobiota bacterium]|nr:Gfo/Idh/MocA family oxidoreductase [Verrucomicrobiota bacterium]